MVRPERRQLLLRLLRRPSHGRVDPRSGIPDQLVQVVASLVNLAVSLELSEELVDLGVLPRRRVGLLLEFQVRERLLQLAVHDALHLEAHRSGPHQIRPHVRLVIVDGPAGVGSDVSGGSRAVKGHATLTLLGHLDRGSPVRERDGDLHHLAGSSSMRGTHEKILSLEIPPNDSRILELLQALRHLQHDVELDLGGERDALALHEVFEVAVRAELGDHGEADVASIAAVAAQARVVLELGAAAAGITENLGGDGWEACARERGSADAGGTIQSFPHRRGRRGDCFSGEPGSGRRRGERTFDGGDLLDDGPLSVAIHDPRAHQLACDDIEFGGNARVSGGPRGASRVARGRGGKATTRECWASIAG